MKLQTQYEFNERVNIIKKMLINLNKVKEIEIIKEGLNITLRVNKLLDLYVNKYDYYYEIRECNRLTPFITVKDENLKSSIKTILRTKKVF